jgi:hypothetical protein
MTKIIHENNLEDLYDVNYITCPKLMNSCTRKKMHELMEKIGINKSAWSDLFSHKTTVDAWNQ